MCQAVFGHYFPCGESCNLYIPTAGLSGSRRADNENVKRRKLRIDMDSTPALESDRLKVEQMIVDGQKQLEAIFETHRQKMALLYSRRFDFPRFARSLSRQMLQWKMASSPESGRFSSEPRRGSDTCELWYKELTLASK